MNLNFISIENLFFILENKVIKPIFYLRPSFPPLFFISCFKMNSICFLKLKKQSLDSAFTD